MSRRDAAMVSTAVASRYNDGAWRRERRSCQDINGALCTLLYDASCISNETLADGLSKTSDR
eukprot:6179090-Pleurochrysis_carterae.AAC.6